MNKVFLLSSTIVLAGCASQSTKMVRSLDHNSSETKTAQCQAEMKEAGTQDVIKWSRMVGTPLLVLTTGGIALLPSVAMNAVFDTNDYNVANSIATNCGGQTRSNTEITLNVVGSAGVGLVTSGLPIGPAGAAAKDTAR